MRPVSSSPILISKKILLVIRGTFIARAILASQRSAKRQNKEMWRRAIVYVIRGLRGRPKIEIYLGRGSPTLSILTKYFWTTTLYRYEHKTLFLVPSC